MADDMLEAAMVMYRRWHKLVGHKRAVAIVLEFVERTR